jgi:hypothetical protein
MKAYTPDMPYRPNGGRMVQLAIGAGTCWHFDAWCYRDALGFLSLHVMTHRGGRELLTSMLYAIEPSGALRYMGDGPIRIAGLDTPNIHDMAVTLQDRKLPPGSRDQLQRCHTDYVLPMCERVPPSFRSRSVWLHYCRAPDMLGVPADVVNYYKGP